MNIDATAVMGWIGDYSLRVAVLIVLVGGASLVMRRASSAGRLFAWTVVLHLAVAMPLLAMALPEVPLPSIFAEPVILVPVASAASPDSLATLGASLPASSWSLQSSLVLVYVAGAGILLLRLLAGWRLTSRVVRHARVVDDLGTATTVRVLESDAVHVPFACGVVRPALVLPASWRSWDAVTLQSVLMHERSHIERRDLWALRLAALYRAATWVNPLSWWLRRKLESLAERASDDAVLAAGVERTAYAEVLVRFFEVAQRTPGRASWQLAMARRGDAEARKRVGRVLSAREGGRMALGWSGRVMVAMGVSVVAVPVIVLAASAPDVVSIQQPVRVDESVQVAPEVMVKITPVQVRDMKIEQKAVQVKPVKVLDVKVKPVDVKVTAAPDQEQEPEQEPWRSTRKATDPDVVAPKVTTSVHPKYTPDAMRAKIQGIVVVEIIVSPDGDVSAARVTTSLDGELGLDDEALKAAKQWTFLPGTYQGQPVALRARITLEFRLH